MLTLKVQTNKNPRTIGGIFFEYCKEFSNIKFMEVFLLIISLFKKNLNDCSKITEGKINEILDYFLGRFLNYIKKSLQIISSAS